MTESTFECIKRMNSEYYEMWKRVKNEYIDKLNKGPLIQDVAFTPHNYNNHCRNIYRIVSDILLKKSAYEIIRPEELFALNTAALLHDISMSETFFNRNQHSFESVKFLIDEREIKNNRALLKIPNNIFNSICDMIKAHSDIKNEDGDSSNYSIGELQESDDESKRIKILAGILRLADELDITSDRLDNEQLKELEKSISTRKNSKSSCFDKAQLEKDEASYKHWLICRYVSKIIVKDENITQINIIPDKHYLSLLSDFERDNCRNLLQRRISKIQKELDKLNNLVFFRCGKFYADISYIFNTIKLIEIDIKEILRNEIFADMLTNAVKDNITKKDVDLSKDDKATENLNYTIKQVSSYEYIHNGINYRAYVPPATNIIMTNFTQFRHLLTEYASSMGLELGNFCVDESTLLKIFIRIDKEKLIETIFKDGLIMNELREVALMAYWIIKYKPLAILKNAEGKESYDTFKVNAVFAFYLILCVVSEYRSMINLSKINVSSHLISKLVDTFNNFDVSKEALMLIVEMLGTLGEGVAK